MSIHKDKIVVDHHTLHRYYTAPASPIARLIILHGYGEHAGRYGEFMQWMADREIACHAIDFRGHGESTGKRAAISRWDEYLDDLSALLAHPEILSTDNQLPLFVLGHSHGGLIAAAAGIRGRIKADGVILSSPYLKLKLPVPMHLWLFAHIASVVWPSVAIKSGIKGSMLTRDESLVAANRADPHCKNIATPRWFIQTAKVQQQVRDNAGKFELPMLMLVAKDDVVADPQAAINFYNSAQCKDKTLKEYEGFRHELLREVGREAIFGEVLAWMKGRMTNVQAPNPNQ